MDATRRMLVGWSVASALILSGGVASSRNLGAQAGRAQLPADAGCWTVAYNGLVNTCGSGTTNTKKLVVPVPVDSYGTFSFAVKAQGGYLQTGPWVSCVAVASGGYGSDYYGFVSSRATTTASNPATFQDLSLGAMGVGDTPTWMSVYLDCDVTYNGQVNEVAMF
jgi:hypothetical protein